MDRKEAIEVVRKKVDYYEADKRLKAALEALIPELAESEDEVVRKAVMSALERAREAHSLVGLELERAGVTYPQVFAWIEKQKEQKPVIIQVENPNIQKLDPNVVIETTTGGTFVHHGPTPPSYLNEPKPAEWSEEDEKQLNWFYRLLDFICKEFPSTWGQNHKGGKEWLKSIRPQPNNNLRWRRATAGANIPESIILPDGDDPRFGKCAVKDSYYIPISELKELPKE